MYMYMYMYIHSFVHNTEHSMGFQPPTPPGTPGRKSLLIPVPSEQSLCLPIRRYISETLICHVLGQPSFSLASLLVSTMKEYLGVKLPANPPAPIPVEDLCKVVGGLPAYAISHCLVYYMYTTCVYTISRMAIYLHTYMYVHVHASLTYDAYAITSLVPRPLTCSLGTRLAITLFGILLFRNIHVPTCVHISMYTSQNK